MPGKLTTATAKLMLPDTLKEPLMCHKMAFTQTDLNKGDDHLYAKAQVEILKRLKVEIVFDKDGK